MASTSHTACPSPPGQERLLALPGSPRGSAGAGFSVTILMPSNPGGSDESCKAHCSWSPVAEDPAMATAAQVIPSPQARTLFNEMAVLARPLGEDLNTLHID